MTVCLVYIGDARFQIIEIQTNDVEIPFMHHMLGTENEFIYKGRCHIKFHVFIISIKRRRFRQLKHFQLIEGCPGNISTLLQTKLAQLSVFMAAQYLFKFNSYCLCPSIILIVRVMVDIVSLAYVINFPVQPMII